MAHAALAMRAPMEGLLLPCVNSNERRRLTFVRELRSICSGLCAMFGSANLSLGCRDCLLAAMIAESGGCEGRN
jgi:hypothetical protein